MKVCFCWRYGGPFFPLKNSPGRATMFYPTLYATSRRVRRGDRVEKHMPGSPRHIAHTHTATSVVSGSLGNRFTPPPPPLARCPTFCCLTTRRLGALLQRRNSRVSRQCCIGGLMDLLSTRNRFIRQETHVPPPRPPGVWPTGQGLAGGGEGGGVQHRHVTAPICTHRRARHSVRLRHVPRGTGPHSAAAGWVSRGVTMPAA